RRAFAAADNGAGVAHPAAGRGGRPGDKAGDGLPAVLLNPLGGFLLGAAADFADQDDAFGFRVVHEELDDVQVRRAIDGIAANADASGLAGAAGGQLPDRFVGESAATADDAHLTPLMDV